MRGMTRRALVAALLVSIAPATAQAQRALQFPPVQSVTARHGMVVAQEGRAALIGAEVLKRGGNAVDAAVAVGFAMAVTYPRAGNIGGGGFMLIHLARGRKDIAIDYRETAPAATTKDTFLNARGEADPAKSRDQGLAIGVPGTVADTTEFWTSGKTMYDPARITVPTLIVIGEWDKDTPPYMAQTLFPLMVNSPGKRLVMLAEATHHMMLEKNRAALFRAVQAFLDEGAEQT